MKKLFWSLVLLAGIGLIGCSKNGGAEASATVTGKVTLPGGSPLPGGTINFRSVAFAHRVGSGEIQADGTYEAKDVPQGECKVVIDNSHLKTSKAVGGYVAPDAKQAPAGTKYVPINQKYTTEAGTDLKTTITGSTATYDVELK
jgi:hypothetical protein